MATTTKYSYAQLEQLWINAGGSAAMAPLMAAIAEAESGGDPNATGKAGEKGLWQINPSAWGSLATYDPAGNAQSAVHVLSVQGLGAWSTYTSGAYKAFLSPSTTPDPNVPASSGTVTTAQLAAATAASSPAVCIIPYPTLNLVVTTVGGGCILTKSQGRAIIGGVLMLTAGTIGLAAAVILAAAAFEKTGAARAVAQAVPPVRAVVGAAGRVGPRA